jgi:hypothetical protein
MEDDNTLTKNILLKLSIAFFSVFISCIATSMAMVGVLFIVEMPMIKKSQMSSALIAVTGFIAALFLAVVTFKKAKHYLSKYLQINK